MVGGVRPLDLGRHVRQPVKLGGGQQPTGGRDFSQELFGSEGRHAEEGPHDDRSIPETRGRTNHDRPNKRARILRLAATLKAEDFFTARFTAVAEEVFRPEDTPQERIAAAEITRAAYGVAADIGADAWAGLTAF